MSFPLRGSICREALTPSKDGNIARQVERVLLGHLKLRSFHTSNALCVRLLSTMIVSRILSKGTCSPYALGGSQSCFCATKVCSSRGRDCVQMMWCVKGVQKPLRRPNLTMRGGGGVQKGGGHLVFLFELCLLGSSSSHSINIALWYESLRHDVFALSLYGMNLCVTMFFLFL